MTVLHPVLLVVAVLVTAGLVAAYLRFERRRSIGFKSLGLTGSQSKTGRRRQLPYALFLGAIALLLVALARPQATIATSRAAGTVILAFDVSNSMGADDVQPTRLAAAQTAAIAFAGAQPDTVDIGVVAFGAGALTTQPPTEDREQVVAAINRLSPGGATSLGQAILGSLSTIIGRTISLPADPDAAPPDDLGYWGSATIVLLSDGEDTGNASAAQAAALAADAGVHIETIGIGTARGATIEVDGFQVATALDEAQLTDIAAITSGSYHQAEDPAALDGIYQSIDLRITTEDQLVELTGAAIGGALLLLCAGGFLMVRWFGRIV